MGGAGSFNETRQTEQNRLLRLLSVFPVYILSHPPNLTSQHRPHLTSLHIHVSVSLLALCFRHCRVKVIVACWGKKMDSSGLRGGLEMTLHQHFQPQMVAFARPEPDHTLQQSQSVYPNHKVSDGEEGGMEDNDGKRKSPSSPWQRMKWTDGMVRLLIMAVYYIGDECGSEGNNNEKKKAGALMQKKGKWKSVSKAMMEKGFYVSPQQCEDKFNDLNKRYKRVNEILGKGTACRVVENQSLLDQMDHLSSKSKDEVRKLLNSKHLFFREMCAYHNSGGGSVDSTVGHHSPEHSLAPPRNISESLKIHHRHGPGLGLSRIDNNNMDGKQSEEDDEEEDDEDDSEEDSEVRCSTKRRREDEKKRKEMEETTTTSLEKVRALNEEVAGVIEDGRRSVWEKKMWMKVRMVKVVEEIVGKEMEGFEIEKERLKWVKYCGNREREMERKRLRNERGKLECDRMLLLLKHKKLEMDLSPSSLTS